MNHEHSKHTDLQKQENSLVKNLKQNCLNGKERDPKKSATIFHKLAKIYQEQKHDIVTHRMISLVRSAVLLNAAKTRSYDDVEDIEFDLKLLCSEILREADGKHQDADLIKLSKNVASDVEEMRNTVEKRLKILEKIPDRIEPDIKETLEVSRAMYVEELLKGIANDYKSIMISVAKYTVEVMGEPPCEYSLAAMGSLARKEITLYSDFENMLILESCHGDYQHFLRYFRWFSVVFQIILTNLGETIVPNVYISSLNNWFYDSFTKRGICFDGMMPHACKFPLGRQFSTQDKPWPTELIRPVNEMLKYLNSEESLKNGYHLSTILTKTCHIYGNDKVFEEFENGVQDLIEQEEQEAIKKSVTKQITEDLGNFATRQSLVNIKPAKQFNVKRVVYRSITILISELGRLYKIPAGSCFDILRELAEKKHISEHAKNSLMFAVAFACEIRLKWYMQKKKQCDDIDSITVIVELMGKQATLRFFQITYALQCDISKRLNLKKVHLYSDPIFLNVSLGHCLNDHSQLQTILQTARRTTSNARYYEFDQCLSGMEKSTSIEGRNLLQNQNNTQEQTIANAEVLELLGNIVEELHGFDDAIECYQKALELITRNTDTGSQSPNIPNQLNSLEVTMLNKQATLIFQIGRCLLNQGIRYDEAKANFENSLRLRAESGLNTDEDSCETLRLVACCLTSSGFVDEALIYLERLLEIEKRNPKAPNIADTYHAIGRCYLLKKEYEKALDHLQTSLKVRKEESFDIASDIVVASTRHCIGKCCFENNQLVDAKRQFKISLKMREKCSIDISADRKVAESTFWLGRSLLDLRRYKKSAIELKKSSQIFEKSSMDISTDRDFANSKYWLGCCLLKLVKPESAQSVFKESLQIYQTISPKTAGDSSAVKALEHQIKVCHQLINASETVYRCILL